MAKYASNVVKQAQAWIGCKESNGTHKPIIDVYNAHTPLARGYKVKYTDEWCATFVSAVAIKCGYTDIIPTECSCPKMIDLLKNLGSFDENDARTPKAGDIIKLKASATYYNGDPIPNWVKNSTLYLREIRANGDYVISTQKSGAVTGVVKSDAIEGNSTSTTSTTKFPYLVEITADALNVRAGAGTNYKVNTVVKKKDVYTIVDEQNGWGKLKSGAGWIDLSYTRRL